MNFIKDIYIDISGKPDAGALIYSKQGDGGMYAVKVYIMDGDTQIVLNPAEVHVAISAKKPDGTVVLDDNISNPDNIGINYDGTVTVLLTPTLQSVSGLERIEIIVLDADNNQVTTATFTNCIVPRAVNPGDMASSEAVLFLKNLIREAEDAINYANSLEGDKQYTHTQLSASEVWYVCHNLGKFPSVTVIDSAGSVVIGDIEYNDFNNITLSFRGGFSGKAICN